jgi:hypothetical protein
MAVAAVFFISQGAGLGSWGVWPVLAIGFAATLVIVAVLEIRVVPGVWKRITESGRVDLERGRFCPDVVPSGGGGTTGTSVVTGGVAAAIVVAVLRLTGTEDIRMVLGAVVLTAAVLLLAGVAWVGDISPLIRVLRWENKNDRTILVE